MSLKASPPAAVRAAHRVEAPKGGKAMNRAHILVVDDEADLLELVQYNLAAAGYDVTCVGSGEEAMAAVGSARPDLVVLDVLLPGMDGLDVCKTLKGDVQTSAIPIVMLTARGEEADIVTGLEVGADDYLTKPFSPRELLARIRAALRRRRTDPVPDAEMIVRGGLVISPGEHDVRVYNQSICLTPTEFRVLQLLAQRPGWVFIRYQIVDWARGTDISVTERLVDVHIAALRRKLGRFRDMIETMRGIGYRFKTL